MPPMPRFAATQLPCQALLLVVCALSAGAATIRYDSRAAWEAAVGSFATEDFESVPLQQVPDEGGTIVTDRFDIVIPSSHDGEIGVFGPANHFFQGDVHCFVPPCDGPGFPGDPEFNDLVFGHGITAFGVDVQEVEDADDDDTTRETIRLTLSGQVFEVGTLEFFGIVSDAPFTLVHIEAPRLTYRLDNVSTVSMPEPTTALLVATGVGWMAALRRSSDMLRRRSLRSEVHGEESLRTRGPDRADGRPVSRDGEPRRRLLAGARSRGAGRVDRRGRVAIG